MEKVEDQHAHRALNVYTMHVNEENATSLAEDGLEGTIATFY
jgi:hypothetical protein